MQPVSQTRWMMWDCSATPVTRAFISSDKRFLKYIYSLLFPGILCFMATNVMTRMSGNFWSLFPSSSDNTQLAVSLESPGLSKAFLNRAIVFLSLHIGQGLVITTMETIILSHSTYTDIRYTWNNNRIQDAHWILQFRSSHLLCGRGRPSVYEVISGIMMQLASRGFDYRRNIYPALYLFLARVCLRNIKDSLSCWIWYS